MPNSGNFTFSTSPYPVTTGKSRGPWQSYDLSGSIILPFPNVATIADGVANTAIQASVCVPQWMKVFKVGVVLTAIDDIVSDDAFNIVVGTGAYTQGDVPPLDNSQTYGYPTVYATAGDALFSADVTFDTINFPGPQTGPQGQLINPGNTILTTDGGSTVLVPTNWDAAIPGGTWLTLRASTVASTGSISNLYVVMFGKPIDPFPASSVPVPNLNV